MFTPRDNMLDTLTEVRGNPALMKPKALEKRGVSQYVSQFNLPDTWKMKEKIDYILSDDKGLCECGNPSKVQSRWCSLSCRNKDESIRESISKKNRINSEERSRKRRDTNKKEYGVDHYSKTEGFKEKVRRTRRDRDYQSSLETIRKYFDGDVESHEYWSSMCEKYPSLVILGESHGTWAPTVQRWFDKIGFEHPFVMSSSGPEREIAAFIESLGFDVVLNDRKVLGGKEIDIFVPSKNFGVEYDGFYWHQGKSSVSKQDLGFSRSINLIFVQEDDWSLRRDIVKGIIRHKLGVSENKIFARKCSVANVDASTARNFFEENHIQGFAVASEYIALVYRSGIVGMASVGRSRFNEDATELIRFCTKTNFSVPGAMSKLLKGKGEMITYADRRYSFKPSYEAFGELIGTIPPGYFWWKNGKKLSRWQTQKSKLPGILGRGTFYNANETEAQNMTRSGWMKIMDLGHWKYRVSF